MAIPKQDYYEGAALVPLIRDDRCMSVRSIGPGYQVNGFALLLVKYSTHVRSPWRFAIQPGEVTFLLSGKEKRSQAFVAFVCGDDGVCCLRGQELFGLLGDTPGTISVTRHYHGRYWVNGPEGQQHESVPLGAWPSLLLDSQ